MFSRKEVRQPPVEMRAAPGEARPAAALAEQKGAPPAPGMKQRPNRTAVPSIIGVDIVVNGTLTSSGQMQIDGQVKGDVRCAILVIGERAQIEGNIAAEDVTIRGHVKGNVWAHKVHLSSTCRVEGDIHRQSMSVEHGAFFEGHSKHSDDPLSGVGGGGRTSAAEGVVKLAR